MRLYIPMLTAATLLSAALAVAEPAVKYDPLAIDEAKMGKPVDLSFTDDARKRELPLRVYLPLGDKPAPVVLFSHGLGGSRENSAYLGKHWSARGYAVVFMQHAGSDEKVWKDAAPLQRLAAMRAAASGQNFVLRVQDVPAVLDQLTAWHKTDGHALAGRLDLEHVGMCGHSFGAVTTQWLSGQSIPRSPMPYTDPRIDAAVAFSPSLRKGADPKQAFGKVKIPWLVMTGTNDTSPINDVDVESRLSVFPALPAGSKYGFVLDKGEHSAFSDRALPGDKEQRNPNHHRAILALSTAFWDAHLRDDQAAKEWLDGDGPKSVLEEQDKWQRK